MANIQKYNYDIQSIQKGLDKNLSLRAIARENEWPWEAFRSWTARNCVIHRRAIIEKRVK